MTYSILLLRAEALFMTSLIQTAGYKMAAIAVVFLICDFQNVDFFFLIKKKKKKKTGRENEWKNCCVYICFNRRGHEHAS